MSAADWWRVGYGHDFAQNIERIAASLEKISKALDRLVEENRKETDDRGTGAA